MKPHRKSSVPHPVRPPKRKRIDPIQQRMAQEKSRARAARAETSQEAEENDWLKRDRRRLIKEKNRLVRLCRKLKKRYTAVLAMSEERNAKGRTNEDDMRVARAIVPLPGMGVAVRGKRVRPE